MVGGVAIWLAFAWWLDARRRRKGTPPSRGAPAAGERHVAAGERRPRRASGDGRERPPGFPAPIAFHRGRDDEPSDEDLVARVRAQVDIPATVEVTAVDGAVVLFGRVPRFAFAALLSRVARVPGVVDVEDRLTLVDDLDADEHP